MPNQCFISFSVQNILPLLSLNYHNICMSFISRLLTNSLNSVNFPAQSFLLAELFNISNVSHKFKWDPFSFVDLKLNVFYKSFSFHTVIYLRFPQNYYPKYPRKL